MEIENRISLSSRPSDAFASREPGATAARSPWVPDRSASLRVRDDRIVEIARAWIGTPYLHQASVKGVGCDCLGLLRGVWRELYGEEPEEPPAYSPDWAEATGAETLYMALARHLREVPLPPRRIGSSPVYGGGASQSGAEGALQPGDIALFRMSPRGPAKHCGIVAENDGRLTLIHARQNKRVSEEPLSQFWRSKLAHLFRI